MNTDADDIRPHRRRTATTTTAGALYWVNVSAHMEIIINVALSVQMPQQLILLTCHKHTQANSGSCHQESSWMVTVIHSPRSSPRGSSLLQPVAPASFSSSNSIQSLWLHPICGLHYSGSNNGQLWGTVWWTATVSWAWLDGGEREGVLL